jgi:hypothetical protein
MQTIHDRLTIVLAATALGASLLVPAAASADQNTTNTAVAANASAGSFVVDRAVAANVSVERASSVERAFVDQDALAVAASDQDLLCILVGIL